MKKYTFALIVFFCFATILPAQAKFPIHLGGFIIGDDITLYPEQIDLNSCRATIFNPYLGEGKIKPHQGFKSGLIAYGSCDQPNKIVRIKLKFNDSSKKFYNILLKKYKKLLGNPTEYKGDSFQTMIAWKWSFKNDNNQTLSLILQHNTSVEDEKIGNAVKLTLTDQLQKERDCYYKNNPEKINKSYEPAASKKDLWRSFVPY